MNTLHKRGALRHLAAGIVVSAALSSGMGCGGGANPVPGSLIGSWGGSQIVDRSAGATLTVTSSGASIDIPCNGVTLSQPLQEDSTGHFTAQGSQYGGGLSNAPPVQVSGQVTGRTMTPTVDFGNRSEAYILVYGGRAPRFEDLCG